VTAKQDRRARKKQHRMLVRCDDCGLKQPLTHGDGSRHADRAPDVAGCIQCGHHYGTYA
jgi:hypothetical protein